MSKRKKRKRKPNENDSELVQLGLVELEPEPETNPERRVGRREDRFVWGLAAGFLLTLLVVVTADHGWLPLPHWGQTVVQGVEAGSEPGESASRSLYLAGMLPPGGRIFVDGRAVEPEAENHGIRVRIHEEAQRLEVRGVKGPLWSTPLTSEATPDTLRPLLTGDVVIEVEHQGPSGTVYLDGAERGSAPGSIGDVGPGWHLLSIRNGDAVLYENACVVSPGEVTVVTVPPTPPRGKGRLIIRAQTLTEDGYQESTGNTVLVDGRPQGETPIELTLSAGFHSIRVEGMDHPPSTEVLYLEAGRSRYVEAEFGREERLNLSVKPPTQARGKVPLAVPVTADWQGEGVSLIEAHLHLIRKGQSRSISIPIVHSGTDDRVWVAVLPAEVLPEQGVLSGYATGTDDVGRTGTSELFQLTLQ